MIVLMHPLKIQALKAANETAPVRPSFNIARLKAEIAAIEGGTQTLEKTRNLSLSFGCSAIDSCLPVEGLACGAVHEIAALPHGEGGTADLALLLASRSPTLPLVWITTRQGAQETGLPYAPSLLNKGIQPERVMLVRTKDSVDALWAAEEALSSQTKPLVVLDMLGLGYSAVPDLTASRRLTLTAESSGATALLLTNGQKEGINRSSMAVATRWQVGAAPSTDTEAFTAKRSFVGDPAIALTLLKARGSTAKALPARWTITWPAMKAPYLQPAHSSPKESDDATTLSVRLVSDLRPGPLAADHQAEGKASATFTAIRHIA